jgi:glucuronate isomerase
MSHRPLHPDRLFPVESKSRDLSRKLYETVKDAPIVSPHGHCDPAWFSENRNFRDPVALLLTPDHYVLRMLYSQGLKLETFGVQQQDRKPDIAFDPRQAFKQFAQHFKLFRGTPTELWFNHVFGEVFGIDFELNEKTSDLIFDQICTSLAAPEFKPQALFERFKIKVLATTDAATDSLKDHIEIKKNWGKRVIPTYRPDSAVDPEHPEFKSSVETLGALAHENVTTFKGYLSAHRIRREFFKATGATATDHGPPSARTEFLGTQQIEALYAKVRSGKFDSLEADTFRAHMLTEFAAMSLDDGLVMQIHPGSFRNHNLFLFKNFGRDKGADIPVTAEYTRNLKPLLDRFGNDTRLSIILFTLDEATYSRELAPLAGHYPALRLGPPWWFHDSPEGMLRFRRQVTETAGFYNTTGFIDDTRAFLSIPARHDVARRIDARFLAELVCEHRLSEESAYDLMQELTTRLVEKAFRLNGQTSS